jgi:MerR family transcriptional regulator, thiopeptide resistance regulator
MRPTGDRSYRTREFALLAGVTVRALHHYDRLGLLRPRRTLAGYRVYTARDLECLEQIVALKFIGVPLREIAILRRADSGTLAAALKAQRLTLERKRRLLDRTIEAMGELEAMLDSGGSADPAVFRRIIEVIEMQNDHEAWKQQYDDLVRIKIERLRSLSPQTLTELRTAWRVLIDEIRVALAEDPASATAQQLAGRWVDLLSRLMGQSVAPSEVAAHQTAQDWQPHMASFVDKPVWDFMTAVLAARPRGRGGLTAADQT